MKYTAATMYGVGAASDAVAGYFPNRDGNR